MTTQTDTVTTTEMNTDTTKAPVSLVKRTKKSIVLDIFNAELANRQELGGTLHANYREFRKAVLTAAHIQTELYIGPDSSGQIFNGIRQEKIAEAAIHGIEVNGEVRRNLFLQRDAAKPKAVKPRKVKAAEQEPEIADLIAGNWFVCDAENNIVSGHDDRELAMKAVDKEAGEFIKKRETYIKNTIAAEAMKAAEAAEQAELAELEEVAA